MLSFLLKVWGLARRYRLRLFLGVLTGVIAGLLEPAMIGVITFVYGMIFPTATTTLDDQLKGLPEGLHHWVSEHWPAPGTGFQSHPGAIVALVALIPAVIFLRGLFTYLNIYLLQWVALRTITDLRVRLFGHLMGLSAGFYNRTSSGELMSRIMNDTSMLQSILSNATTVIIKDPVIVCSLLGWLMWQQPGLTLISMVVLPVSMIPIVVYSRKTRRVSGGLQTYYANLSRIMSEGFTGNRVIKAYNLEATVVERFRSTSLKLIGYQMRIIRAMETPGPLLEFFGSIGVALVILYVALPKSAAAIPDPKGFLRLLVSIFALYRPFKNLARLHNNLEQARAASARVFELLATENSIREPARPKPLKAAGADLEFENIEMSFDDKPALCGVTLTVKAGQVVALVGASGSGKTTLTNLLLRFYDPQRGTIRIDGVDIREVTTRDLRNQIAVVTQETVLFDDTVRHNIELGRPGATEEEIIAAAKHAHAHEFIMEKPQGYDTLIGERGVTLSGGQRQRVAIARAILKNAPILILDEATSALDTESERLVQAALEELMVGRTSICIAHRLSTIQRADAIVVMANGRIVETGRHAELLQKDGVYKRLYDLQFQSPSSG